VKKHLFRIQDGFDDSVLNFVIGHLFSCGQKFLFFGPRRLLIFHGDFEGGKPRFHTFEILGIGPMVD
jgi:hypothetical protein